MNTETPQAEKPTDGLLAIEDQGRVVIQVEAPAWIAPSAWISCDAEHAIGAEDWA